MTRESPSLSVTRQSLVEQIQQLKDLASEIHGHLYSAHERHYLDTLDFYRAAEHVASTWRSFDHAIQNISTSTSSTSTN